MDCATSDGAWKWIDLRGERLQRILEMVGVASSAYKFTTALDEGLNKSLARFGRSVNRR